MDSESGFGRRFRGRGQRGARVPPARPPESARLPRLRASPEVCRSGFPRTSASASRARADRRIAAQAEDARERFAVRFAFASLRTAQAHLRRRGQAESERQRLKSLAEEQARASRRARCPARRGGSHDRAAELLRKVTNSQCSRSESAGKV
jgi:hypothetical protein